MAWHLYTEIGGSKDEPQFLVSTLQQRSMGADMFTTCILTRQSKELGSYAQSGNLLQYSTRPAAQQGHEAIVARLNTEVDDG